MASELIDTAQAILTATDTALSKAYRDEDRAWRKDDLSWREQERQFMCVLVRVGADGCSFCRDRECRHQRVSSREEQQAVL